MRGHRLVVCVVAGFLAVPVAGGPAAAAPEPCPVVTPADVRSFLDTTVPEVLDTSEGDTPGATVSVVAGGKVIGAYGYGLADVENKVPMDGERSVTRIASVTKLFTWTAVMQQVEAGTLDLDADVNTYLTSFEIPDTYPQKITLRHLMNHTAGFEDQVVGIAARPGETVGPLSAFLEEHMPARIRPPGIVSAYSNYGAALAGLIVSEVTGKPYDGYVRERILDPLGMTRSTAEEPLPAALAGDLVRSYDSEPETPERVPFMLDRMPPDGSVSATAADMAKFMDAHLSQGAGILKPETAARMHGRSFSADPRLDGYAHGFKERTINNRRVIMHDGSWEGFLTGLWLMPSCDLGVFIGTNGTSGTATIGGVPEKPGKAREPGFEELFFNRFAPGPVRPEASTANVAGGTTEPAAAESGWYVLTRHNESTVEKIQSLLGPANLTVNDDGTVKFRGRTWVPIGDGVYWNEDFFRQRMSFRTDRDGTLYVVSDGTTFQKAGFTEGLYFTIAIMIGFVLAALSALAVPVSGLRRRYGKHPVTPAPGRWRLARALTAAAALLGLWFVVQLMLTLSGVVGDVGSYIYGPPFTFRLLLTLPLVMMVVFAAGTVCTVLGWRAETISRAARIHQVVILVGLTAVTWFLWNANAVGWWNAV